MKITACPKCGSKNISMGTMGSGITFGITSWNEMCKDCGYQGQPIVFDSEKKYKKFLVEVKQKPLDKKTELKEEPSVEDEVDEVIDVSQKDKDVVELLQEYEKEKVSKPIWPKNKVWWPEIGVALALAVLAYLSGLISETSRMGIDIAILYSILYFAASFVIFLFVIVIIEYFLRNVLNILSK